MLQIPGLFIADTGGKGRGVFSAFEISPLEVIEVCPVILIPQTDLAILHHTKLYEYYFLWPGKSAGACIALGFGSIYNHSATPNAEITYNLDEVSITLTSLCLIREGEEVTIDYKGGISNAQRLWFEIKE